MFFNALQMHFTIKTLKHRRRDRTISADVDLVSRRGARSRPMSCADLVRAFGPPGQVGPATEGAVAARVAAGEQLVAKSLDREAGVKEWQDANGHDVAVRDVSSAPDPCAVFV